jgi:superfamily II DNA or RNA helicase
MSKLKTLFMPSQAFPFQEALIEWALDKQRAALLESCGLGKTIQQLAWAENAVRNTNKPALVLTPLAVSAQTVEEAAKFGMDAVRCGDGKVKAGAKIIVTNYERIHHFNRHDFSAVVCDEAGILKNHSGATRNAVIAFMKETPYRLLCTATPAPNDVIELGNSIEALGIMRRVDMLARYFIHDSADTGKWRLKGHAADAFWRFVASWARAIRHPRDLGFDQTGYDLPELTMSTRVLPSKPLEGFLLAMAARTLNEQRDELRSTIESRCGAVADIANSEPSQFVAWCSLNAESEMLKDLINGAVELSGSDDDDDKEEKILAFSRGEIRAMVTKPKICSHGINWQNCHRLSAFPSHSHEQFYQMVRRFWRFRQTHPVHVSIVTTESESAVLDNLRRKENDADEMFNQIVANMLSHYSAEPETYQPTTNLTLPSWL